MLSKRNAAVMEHLQHPRCPEQAKEAIIHDVQTKLQAVNGRLLGVLQQSCVRLGWFCSPTPISSLCSFRDQNILAPESKALGRLFALGDGGGTPQVLSMFVASNICTRLNLFPILFSPFSFSMVAETANPIPYLVCPGPW